MRRGIRALVVATLATAALALGGCAGLPTDGRVQPGQEADSGTVPEFAFRVPPPPAGASPEQIVEGFLRAGQGPASGWAVARQYLADDVADSWQPSANVTVAVPGTLDVVETADGQVSATLLSAATVDSAGLYSLAQDATTTLQFSLAQRADGEWRITAVPDGIVLDEDIFSEVFASYALQYWDPTWTYLVPDVRWFPRTNTATLIVDALVDGRPSFWLSGSVASAFPADIAPRQAVPVESGVAEVELGSAALQLDQVTQARMQTQLEASLAGAGITAVQMSVNGTPLDPGSAPARTTDVSTQALVADADGFGFVSGTQLTPVAGLDALVARFEPTAVQTSAGLDAAAVLLPTGAAARLSTDDEAVIVDDRPELVAPTLDPEGWIWSVPRDQPGALLATPSGGGTGVQIASPWQTEGATAVAAIRMSRDGARIAAIVTAGGRDEVWVAGVVRDGDGSPVSLGGEHYTAAELDGSGIALDWLDDTIVGVLEQQDAGTALRVQTVGGQADVISAPSGSVQIAGANQPSTVRVRDADGVLYARRGSTWGEALSGVLVLATQLGRPD